MSKETGRWRPVHVRIWRHPGFVQMKESTQRLVFYLLTGPQTNRIGLFHFSIGTASEDLKLASETIRKGLDTVSTTLGWLYDEPSRVVYIPSWWRWNPPSNPKHLKGNLSDLGEVPPSSLVEAFARNLDTLPETLHETFIEGCRIRLASGMANQNLTSPVQKQKQNLRVPRGEAETGDVDGSTRRHEALLAAAREVCRVTNPKNGMEHLMDAFAFVSQGKNLGTPSEKQAALTEVLSELRMAGAL